MFARLQRTNEASTFHQWLKIGEFCTMVFALSNNEKLWILSQQELEGCRSQISLSVANRWTEWVYSEGVPWVMPAVSPDRSSERKAGQATLEFPLKTEQVSQRARELAFVWSWNRIGLILTYTRTKLRGQSCWKNNHYFSCLVAKRHLTKWWRAEQ